MIDPEARDALREALTKVTGEPAVLAEDVGWDLKHPCDDCPFTRSAPYHEGVASSLADYANAIESRAFSHTCHKTDCRPTVDGPRTWRGQVQHCAGAVLMLLKTGRGVDLQLPLLEAVQAGKLDVREMKARAKADANVFTLPQLLVFYAHELGKRIRGDQRRQRREADRAGRLRAKAARQRKKQARRSG